MTTRLALLPGLAFLAGTLACAGCEQPHHRAAIERRERNLQQTTSMLQDMENSHSEKMHRTVAMLEGQHADDVESSRQNVERVHRAVRMEFDRWTEQQPTYRKRFEELMRGDPANIDRMLPYMIY